mmetsp:Transcript_21579/g.54354  ORF Transcript_21579/g.54354 Transcript_21579/m.54354 type:complete len:270 (-) Transcript_21579:2739-3548(-)
MNVAKTLLSVGSRLTEEINQQNSEREHIHLDTVLVVADHLGRQIHRGPNPGHSAFDFPCESAHSEVSNLTLPVCMNKTVGWLEIPVDQRRLVSMKIGHASTDINRNAHAQLVGQRVAIIGDHLFERTAFHVLSEQSHIVGAGTNRHTHEAQHVGMVERMTDFHLDQKVVHELRIIQQEIAEMKGFDGNVFAVAENAMIHITRDTASHRVQEFDLGPVDLGNLWIIQNIMERNLRFASLIADLQVLPSARRWSSHSPHNTHGDGNNQEKQ